MMQETTHSRAQQQRANPMVQLLRDQELGIKILTLVMMPLTKIRDFALKVLLLVGLVALWNRRFLGNRCPKISRAAEELGVACIMLAFFSVVGSCLPPRLAWAAWACFAVCQALPFILGYFRDWNRAPTRSEAHFE